MRYLNYATKLLHPRTFYTVSSISLRHFLQGRNHTKTHDVHLKETMGWLMHAQDVTKDYGVSAFYSLINGWAPSYVETTGYIIPTFFNYASYTKNREYEKRAVAMADFELTNQMKNGAFPGAYNKAVVFNTGQVLFGLCKAYEKTKQKKYLASAKKAADWLVKIMDADGCWRKHTYLGHVHTYNIRVAWSLLRVHAITKNEKYRQAAVKNVEWALTQQLDNGWFANNAFYPEQEPLVHTIAYAIRGLLECGLYLKNERCIVAARKAAIEVRNNMRPSGFLAGSFNKRWQSSVDWCCLTGVSQMAIIWLKLGKHYDDKLFLTAAARANDFVKSTQNLRTNNPNIRGGVAGAYPIYGWYAPFSFINWAPKFLADALMLENKPEWQDRII